MNHESSHALHQQIDESAALAGLDGNRDLLHDLADMFCEDAPIVLGELRTAIIDNDAPAARRAAHSLKGLAATFYAQPTIEQAERLEHDAAAGELGPLKDGGVDRLERCVVALIAELKSRRG